MRLLQDLATRQLEHIPHDSESASNKIITPATTFTVARPVLAVLAAEKLVRGERGVTPLVIGMAVSDAEGYLARFVDHYTAKEPGDGVEWLKKLLEERGTSKFGIAADKYADMTSLAIVAGAALKAPRVSLAGKAAVGAILTQQSIKAAWAVQKGMEYHELTGEILDFQPNGLGKQGMFEQFIGLTAAVATNDTDRWGMRRALDAVAVGAVSLGVKHSEQARKQYDEIIPEMIDRALQERGGNVAPMPPIAELVPPTLQ